MKNNKIQETNQSPLNEACASAEIRTGYSYHMPYRRISRCKSAAKNFRCDDDLIKKKEMRIHIALL